MPISFPHKHLWSERIGSDGSIEQFCAICGQTR